jgi:hypothetical protein
LIRSARRSKLRARIHVVLHRRAVISAGVAIVAITEISNAVRLAALFAALR